MSLRSWLLATAILTLAAPAPSMAQPQPGGPPTASAPERPGPEQRAARQRQDQGSPQQAPPAARAQPGPPALGAQHGQRDRHDRTGPMGEGQRRGPAGAAQAPPNAGALQRGGREEVDHGVRRQQPGETRGPRPQIMPGARPATPPPIAAPGREAERRFERGQEHRTPPAAQTRRQPRNWPQLGDWRRDLRGPDADHAGRQWRDEHRGWDKQGVWRRRPDWWRHDRGFRLYIGPRIGFFFIPELGYVSVPHEYEHGYWAPGGYLPEWFWRYAVRDYWRFGLPAPPPGCVWVWVNDDIALIDADTGYILDMVRNVW